MKQVVALVAVVAMSGCATKKDIRFLRADMQAMAARQDSVLRSIQRQNTQLLDSIRATMSLTVQTRGNTTSQLTQFESTIRQLLAQMADINSSLTRLDRRMTALEEKPPVIIQGGQPAGAGGGNPDEMYRTGATLLEDESWSSARAAFEEFVASFPNDARAADAQFNIARTYQEDEQWNLAYSAYEQVVTRWPQSPAAPRALFSAGELARERREIEKARAYYQRVEKEYEGTDVAREAQRARTRLPRG